MWESPTVDLNRGNCIVGREHCTPYHLACLSLNLHCFSLTNICVCEWDIHVPHRSSALTTFIFFLIAVIRPFAFWLEHRESLYLEAGGQTWAWKKLSLEIFSRPQNEIKVKLPQARHISLLWYDPAILPTHQCMLQLYSLDQFLKSANLMQNSPQCAALICWDAKANVTPQSHRWR